ncbi:MAG: SRPBCC domain-containing protein [Solirubrobacteraceae bacterium]
MLLATIERRPDGQDFAFSVEFTFEEQDGQTRMTIVQSGFPTEDLRAEHARGVPHAFDRLERAIPRAGKKAWGRDP